MQISDILTKERLLCHIKVNSKKRVLEKCSELLVTGTSFSSYEIFDSLWEREELGSTGFGRGVAIPHARVAQSNITLAAFLQLDEGIDFDAIDKQPVDLLFALMVPENSTNEHLKLLAQLAQMFSEDQFCERLRQTTDVEAKFKLLTLWQPSL
jgi:PTS system nitrogen regulatory IIA component